MAADLAASIARRNHRHRNLVHSLPDRRTLDYPHAPVRPQSVQNRFNDILFGVIINEKSHDLPRADDPMTTLPRTR